MKKLTKICEVGFTEPHWIIAGSLGRKPFAKLTARGEQARARAFCGPACSQRKRREKGTKLRMSIFSIRWSHSSSHQMKPLLLWEDWVKGVERAQAWFRNGVPTTQKETSGVGKEVCPSVKHGGPGRICELSRIGGSVRAESQSCFIYLCFKKQEQKQKKRDLLIY